MRELLDQMFEPLENLPTNEILTPISGEKDQSTDLGRETKLAWIRGQVDKSVPINNTPAEKYLTEHRGIKSPWPDALRYSASYQHEAGAKSRSCLLSVVKNGQNEVVGVQTLELDPVTGEKAHDGKPDRFSNGYIGEGAVFLASSIEASQTLVIGEGIETVMTRILVSPCEGYACLGTVRFIEPQKHHRRVEILADNDKRETARCLARQYAEKGLPAYVVTVSEALGAKADMNDALRQQGLSFVRTAVEDAEPISTTTRNGLSNFRLDIGSDIEIAQRIIERLEEIYGTIVVCDEKIWRFDRTHWVAFDTDPLARFIHRADGAIYCDTAGRPQRVKLNKGRVVSIIDAAMKYRQEPGFFASAPRGINCESGFIRFGDDGSIEHSPHARQWKQRHVVRGRWHDKIPSQDRDNGLLAKYLQEAFNGDDESESRDKIRLLGEIAGCAAMGIGTKVRNPKAIILFSEEGGTGKSTFNKLLRAMPNAEAVSSVPASKFGDDKYAFRLIAKVLNAVDELSDRAVRSDVFKRMITGDPIPARDVYRSATDFEPVALHVFSTNVLPSFSGGIDGGTARRLLPVEFSHVVPEDERDPTLPERIIHDEADLLLRFAVLGAQRLIKQGDFTIPASSKLLLSQWLLAADPVRAWADERLEVTKDENLLSATDLYEDFLRWTETRGINSNHPPSIISFGRRLASAVPGLEHHRSNGSWYRNVRLRAAL